MRSPRACVSDVRCGAAQPVAASCSHLCYLLCPDGVWSLCRSLRAAEWIAWPKVRRSFDLPSTWILVEDTSPIWKPRTLRKKQSATPGAPSLPIGGHGETTFADLEGSTRADLSQPPLARGPALLIFLRISSVAFVWVVRLTPRSRLASGTCVA